MLFQNYVKPLDYAYITKLYVAMFLNLFKYIIYLIYVHHRSNISYLSQECCSTLHCRLLLFLTHHGLQMPTLWQNGVNPFGLNNKQGQCWNTMVFPFLPMAVTILVFQCLFRIPSLIRIPLVSNSQNIVSLYWSQRSRTLIFQPRNLKKIEISNIVLSCHTRTHYFLESKKVLCP